jgi:hypothetical protein
MTRKHWTDKLRDAAARIEQLKKQGATHGDAVNAVVGRILDEYALRYVADLLDVSQGGGHCYPEDAHRVVMVGGVERYRQNRIVRDLIDRVRDSRNGMDLNCISRDQQRGHYTLDERKELYRLSGYSLCGFEDVFAVDEDSDVQE